jgi:hypothetical protein
MSLRSRALRAAGVGLLAAALALSTTAALAADQQSSNPSSPVQLPNDQHLSGTLGPAPVGFSGNQFAYYHFRYDGGNRVTTINMQVYPDDKTILSKVGFVVYGPKTAGNPTFKYVISGSQTGQIPNVSGNLISQDPGDYVIQVHNDSQVVVNFAIWADNLPIQPSQVTTAPSSTPAAAPAPAPAATPAPAPSATPVPSATPSTGAAAPAASPTGTPGGTVKSGNTFSDALAPGKADIFQFDYPGDLSVYTINLEISPDDPVILQHAGFQVFTPSGGLQVKGGAQPKLVPNVSADVISKVPGTYTVKIFNDQPNTAVINYTVTLVTKPPATK